MIKSVVRAIDILAEISRRGDWVGVREIARAMNMKVPTVHQLIKTLSARGLLEFHEERRQYRLGLGLWTLAEKIDPLAGLRKFIEPSVDEVFDKFGETVVALARIENDVRVIAWRQSKHSLAVIVPDENGVIKQPHYLAGGRIVLAFSGREVQEAYRKKLRFPEAGKNLFRCAEDFDSEMIKIRAQGYALTRNIADSGIGALAVPVLYGSGGFVIALAGSMPLNRFKAEKKDEFLKSLKDISRGDVGP